MPIAEPALSGNRPMCSKVWPKRPERARTTIGEIATAAWPQPVGPHPDVTVFYELIGPLGEQIEPRLAAAQAHLDQPWAAQRLPSGLKSARPL